MIVDQSERSSSCTEDFSGIDYSCRDSEMTGVCGELKRRGVRPLETVPEVTGPGQHHSHSGGHRHHGKMPTQRRSQMKLELTTSGNNSRPTRVCKQRPLALFKARLAQVQAQRNKSGSLSGSPCKSPGSVTPSGQ